jgi:glycosyltransferase involved in cell wall biosynthesis
LKVPFVLTVHDNLGAGESLLIDRQYCRRIIAVSEPVKTDLIQRAGLPESLIEVIPSGVDQASPELESAVFQQDRVPVIGTAGPLEAVKGFPFFLRAAAMVLQTGRQVEFLVAGAGPEESNLRRLARDLGINDHVTFAPNLLDFDDALKAMDVFVLPSLQQGLGTTMLEAMSFGRPVIATKVGGVFHSVTHGGTGLLVPPSDSESLSARIMELLDDPEKARAIGHRAREMVESEFNVAKMLDRTEAVYREVVNQA